MSKKYHLSALDLDEVSLVDYGANQKAHVVLFKREVPSLDGIKLMVGFDDQGGANIQSVHFGKGWTNETASHWLSQNKLVSKVVSKNNDTLQFQQEPVDKFNRLRIVTPGTQLLKALSADDGFNALQSAVNSALQEKYPTKNPANGPYCAWVRDIIGDNVIYDYDGCTYRSSFEVGEDNDGDVSVVLGPEVEVDLVYQDVTSKSVQPDKNLIPAEVLFEIGKIEAGIKMFQFRVNKLKDEVKKSK